MGGKQIGIVVVCLIVIGVAVAYTVKKQVGPSGPPQHVLDEQRSYMCSKCGHKQQMSLGDWDDLKVDATTKYRKCPKCSEMAFTVAGQCPHCLETIPSPRESAEGKRLCPKCGKDVMAAPGAPESVPPAK